MKNKIDLPLISVVMPVKNGEKFIEASIASVMKQTYQNWELLVVNDHSTDKTEQLVSQLMETDKRIRLISLKEEQTGVAYSRRCAIDHSTGSWVAFLDGDDTWSLQKLDTQMQCALAGNNSFIFTASSFLKSDGSSKKYIFHAPSEVKYPEILKQDVISCSSVLIKKDFLINCFYEQNNDICDDYAAWIRVLRDHADRAIGIDQPLLQYRISRNSLSFNKFQSAYRTYLTYRHVGLSPSKAAYYWCWYVFRSLKKYAGVYFC